MTRPLLTGQTPDYDIYRTDNAKYGDLPIHVRVIGLWDTMPATLLAACRARRAATLTGVCPLCSYTDQLHQVGCAAEIRMISAMVSHWIAATRRHDRGRRLTENPADTISTAVYQTIPKPRYATSAM